MISLDQLLKLAGDLPLDKLAHYLQLDKLTGYAADQLEAAKNRERMSSVDTAWLRMDTPTNLMLIVGVMMCDGMLDIARFKRTLEERLLRYARFRQRVVQDATGAWWVEDQNFDIDNHVHMVNLPAPAGKRALEEFVAGLAAQALDPHKPLWRMTVVEHYAGDGVLGSAVIMRIHHCIADGIALSGVMYSLTDASADAAGGGAPPAALRPAAGAPAPMAGEPAGERDFLASLYEPLSDATAKALALYGGIWAKSMDLIAHPQKVAGYAKVAADVAAEIAYLLTLSPDSATSFKGKPSATKRVAWSTPLPLAEVKAVCRVLGVSVNDVLLTAVAGAMREYLAGRGEVDAGTEVRAFVPVNLRPGGDQHRLGNCFGLVALTLPVGIVSPFERLQEVKRRMDELKSSYQAALSMGILATVGYLPRPVQQQVLDLFSSKGTAVMTNVPGPQTPRYLAGRRLVQQMFWVPQSGDIGIGVSILSYAGQVQFGLITDRKFVPEPSLVVDRFAAEFEKIVLYLLLEGTPPAPRVSIAAPPPGARPATAAPAKAAARKPPRKSPARKVPPAKKAAARRLKAASRTPATAPKPAGLKTRGLLARTKAL